jgi:hypothetical protein
MATRYWVGGVGNWSSTTKWSTTSGGTSGASVPTDTDDVVFDANSGGKFIATVDTARTCASLTITPSATVGVFQLAITASLTVTGNFTTSGTAGNNRIWIRGTTYGVRTNLVCNGTVSISDCDFRDIIVTGTSAPISGTRIGNRGDCTGITFDAPKTVYWNLAGNNNWSANGWADTSGGTPDTNNFPLPQDTAVFNNSGSGSQTLLDSAIGYVPTVDMSTRTTSVILTFTSSTTVYGSWISGSGFSSTGSSTLTFSGEGTKTITSAGKTFTCPINIDAYGGTVELADALDISSTRSLIVTNGTFDTKNYNVSCGTVASNSSTVRAVKLGSSTITCASATALNIANPQTLTFDAGTSQINITSASSVTIASSGVSFYNVTLTAATSVNFASSQTTTFNNLSFTAPASAGLLNISFTGDIGVNGTLTCAGATAVRRIFVRSGTIGTPVTLTVNAWSASPADIDFRDIALTGSVGTLTGDRFGDCGGNSGITFPAPKTVYWNLAGSQSWAATAWATSSGGTPNINNFPLAQDTAVFDEAGSAGTVFFGKNYNTGTLDASGRTSAMTFNYNGANVFYGNYILGSGVTLAQTVPAAQIFSGRGTQTLTTAGKTFLQPITIDSATGTVQLGDALTLDSGRTLTLTSGTFDAVTYNVTVGLVIASGGVTLKMGSGLWTLSGTGLVWNADSSLNLIKGTADILLSNTSTSAREFRGGGLSYNKLTIGGATGTSTTTVAGSNQFTELASTKTVAHTIALGTVAQTFGAWTVAGTAGNVVTLTGTAASHILAGSCTSGIDYLAMGSIGFAATSPAEFYAGANSTGTAGAPVYRTAKPADSTRYWVGGTGNWSDTARWSTSSGGASGASVPRSHDDVVFDTLSNLTAYTATVNAVTGGIRCKALTIAGPALGNVTLAGSTAINGIHGDVTLPATGLTRTYNGAITLSGSTTGKTFTTNGVTLGSVITVNGVGCEWTLGSALNNGSTSIFVTNGTFDTGNYNISVGQISSDNSNTRTITLGSSTATLSSNVVFTTATNLTFNAGTSQINLANGSAQISSGIGQTFYNVTWTSTSLAAPVITGANTFNNLTITGRTSAGLANLSISANQTINGTLTLSAGTNATMRTFVRSDTIGTPRTLTCNAVASLTDIDFRDITIAGSAAPVSGTRLGDCGGNSGITFDAAKTVYWNLAGSQNWSATGWASSSGTAPAINNFPLAQDTAVFDNAGAAGTVSIQGYNIGTLDASGRTSAFTLNHASPATFYGSYILGSSVTISGTTTHTFSGRGTMTFTSAGKTITFPLTVDTPTSTFQLGDALNSSDNITHTRGTFDAVSYNVTCKVFTSANANVRTINMGSGLWTLTEAAGNTWNLGTATNLTFNKGTADILLSNNTTTARTFSGVGASYNKLTIGGNTSTSTTTINGNNTFTEIASTKTVTHTIALTSTSQRVGAFTVTGTAGNVVTITGNTSNLIYTGSGNVTGLDYLNIQGRAYGANGETTDIWYGGANSINSGSLGWVFASGVTPPPSANSNFFLMFG